MPGPAALRETDENGGEFRKKSSGFFFWSWPADNSRRLRCFCVNVVTSKPPFRSPVPVLTGWVEGEAGGTRGCVCSVGFRRGESHVGAHRRGGERKAAGPVAEAAISAGRVQLPAYQDSTVYPVSFCLVFGEVGSW